MKIELKILNLKCENIRSVTSRQDDLDGQDAKFSGQTGTGKSSIADGWCWLINSKDSLGRGSSLLRPVYTTGPKKEEPIRGLVMAIEATVRIDGGSTLDGTWVLRKEEHESRKEEKFDAVTKWKYSYPKKHFINGDFVKEKDFNSWLAQIADPDVLRMLTDLKYFLADEKKGGMHHTKRRKLLRAMGGDIGTPEGFSDVDEAIKGRTLAGYKKELTDQKTEYEKEQEAISPQIGENQRYTNYEQVGPEEELIARRDKANQAIAEAIVERKEVVAGETQRQDKIDEVNTLNCQKLERETELKNDTSGTKSLCDEKATLEASYGQQEAALAKLRGELATSRAALSGAENELAQSMLTLKSIREEYTKAKNATQPDSEYNKMITAVSHTRSCQQQTCSVCKGLANEVSEYVLNEPERKRKADLAAIAERGNNIKKAVDERKVGIEELQGRMNLLLTACEKAESELREKEQAKNDRIALIEQEIRLRPTTPPDQDGQWQDLTAEIKKLQAEIGEPVSDQLEKIDAQKTAAEATRDKCSDALRNADKAKEAEARIVELEALNRELAQKIVTISGKLHRIKLYKKAESELITTAVNRRFKHLTFKLFKTHLNGELEDCCEAMLNGKPYPEISGGEKMLADVDANRAVAVYYDRYLPLLIDERQRLTIPLENPPCQTIEFYGVEGVDELQVEIKAKERTAAA